MVTFNLWNDSADSRRRIEILLPQLIALKVQVIGLQEVRRREGGGQAEAIARALEAEFRYAVVDPHSVGGPIGNAVISRLPILGQAILPLEGGRPDDPRNALRCDLETPAGRLPFVTTHLSWELDAAAVRERQVLLVDEWARRDPGELPTILCGDFNCTPDSQVHQFLTGRATLAGRSTYWRDAFQRRHPRSDGFTWSERNPHVARNVERDRRLDYIFVGPMHDRGPGAILHARVVLDLPATDGTYPSDHFGVFAEIATLPVDVGV